MLNIENFILPLKQDKCYNNKQALIQQKMAPTLFLFWHFSDLNFDSG